MFSPRARRITPLVTIPAGVARLFLDFFIVPPTQVEAIDLNRPGRFGERPYLFFWLRQNDDVTNELAQMRFGVRRGKRFLA